MIISVCLKYLRSSSSSSTRLIQYFTESLLWMFLQEGASCTPFMYILMGMDYPLSGHPSITSYLTRVSVQVLVVVPVPKVSFLTRAISMLFILILTRWKLTLPTIISLRWQKDLLYSKSMCRQSQIPTSIFIGTISVSLSTDSSGNRTAKSSSFVVENLQFLATTTRTKYLTRPAMPLNVQYSFSKLGNLNLQIFVSVRIPAGYSSFERELNYVERSLLEYISELPRQPMRQHLMPRCQYFLVSLRETVTVPLMSSFLKQAGNFTFSLPFLTLWNFGFSLGSNLMSISTPPVSPPKKEVSLS